MDQDQDHYTPTVAPWPTDRCWKCGEQYGERPGAQYHTGVNDCGGKLTPAEYLQKVFGKMTAAQERIDR